MVAAAQSCWGVSAAAAIYYSAVQCGRRVHELKLCSSQVCTSDPHAVQFAVPTTDMERSATCDRMSATNSELISMLENLQK